MRVIRPEVDADLSPPSRAEIMNERSHTSILPICPHGVCRDNCTSTIFLVTRD
jgi:hypothetical protein